MEPTKYSNRRKATNNKQRRESSKRKQGGCGCNKRRKLTKPTTNNPSQGLKQAK